LWAWDLYSGYTVEVEVECTQDGGKIHILSPPLILAGKVSRGMVVHRIAGIAEVNWVMGSIYIYTGKNNLTQYVTDREAVFGRVIHTMFEVWHYKVL